MQKNTMRFTFLTGILLFLSGCSSFTGVRTPLYDGEPFVPQPDKIAAYNENREIIGEEKELYMPETFSPDILKPSMDYIDHEPILLEEERTYTVGVDMPASRVTLFGEKNDPDRNIGFHDDPFAPPKPEQYEVGTMTIRDADGNFYFENMFHIHYGVLVTQVDLIEGHTIEITGNNPKVVLFYDEVVPEDPYIFDTRWEEYIAGLEAEGIELIEHSEEDLGSFEGGFIGFPQDQPIVISEEEQTVNINAGIYEVGVHLEAGMYEITEQSVPSHTAMYLFRGTTEPQVFDISKNIFGIGHSQSIMNSDQMGAEFQRIELKDRDKIYPHYIDHLLLTKIDE